MSFIHLFFSEKLLIENKSENLTIITKITKNICLCILKTLKLSNSPYLVIHSLKLLISKSLNNNKNEKTVEISGSSGDNATCENLIALFVIALAKKSRQIKIISNKSNIIFDEKMLNLISINSSNKGMKVFERQGSLGLGSITSDKIK